MQENIAVISLKNIKHNLFALRKNLSDGVKIYAVVKANAYGHGAERVAQSLQPFVDGFVVTSVQEGCALRYGGVQKQILVLTPPLHEDDVFYAIIHSLTLTVCSFASLKVVQNAVQKFRQSVCVHIKINTGMNRLGLSDAPLNRLYQAIKHAKGVRVTGVYSHLYAPDNAISAQEQRKNFMLYGEWARTYFGDITLHLSATGGTLLGENYHFSAVRLGIGLYGYLPQGFEEFYPRLRLRPAMKLYTHALQTHVFTGGGVGYSVAKKSYQKLTAYRLGYADGLPRASGGDRLHALGNLCMDSCIKEGEDAYGNKRLVFSSVQELAKKLHTIPYEILCNATKRARIEYVEY